MSSARGSADARARATGEHPDGAACGDLARPAKARGRGLCPSEMQQAEDRRLSREQALDLAEAYKGAFPAERARLGPGSYRRDDGTFVLVYPDGSANVVGPL